MYVGIVAQTVPASNLMKELTRMKGISDLSQIEQLKILKSIFLGCQSNEDFELYLKDLSLTLDTQEIKRRLDGLLLEDEFLLLCTVMRSCSTINRIEFALSEQMDMKSPDYIAVFDAQSIYNENSYKGTYLVEVKTSEKCFETKELSNGFFKKYDNFSNLLKIPLLFSSRIKINGQQRWWIIQNKNQFLTSKRKSNTEQLTKGIGHILLNDYFISSAKTIYISKIFSEKNDKSIAYYPKYGYLKSINLVTDTSSIILEDDLLFINLFLDCFGQREISTCEDGNDTILETVIDIFQDQLLSDMLIRANYSVLDANGNEQKSASRLLALVENGKASLIYRDFLEKSMIILNKEDFLFFITKIGDANGRQLL